MVFKILFFFSALGVFNALLICIYLFFFKRPKNSSNYFFGLMLLALTIRVGKSVFYYFLEEFPIILLQVGISACLFIGPSIYFYIKSVVQPEKEAIKNWKYHYLFLLTLVLIVGVLYPWKQYPDLWYPTFFNIIYWVWFLYIVAAGLVFRNAYINRVRKDQKFTDLDFWLVSVIVGNLFIWLAYRTVVYTSYIVGALSFTFIFYLLFLLYLSKRKKISIFDDSPVKYSDKKIETSEAEELIQKLNQLMQDEELFKNPDLKLAEVAKRMNIIPHHLSQLLNDNINKGFTFYINECRIEEAKRAISENGKITLEAIGYECGFNSKSTFYTAFKKHTGTTPSKFKQGL